MIRRHLYTKLLDAINAMPVIVLLGARQVGKTTLSLQISQSFDQSSYLDLELDSDMAKLDEAEDFLRRFEGQLLIIDEVQLKPDLFSVLRGLVDIRKRSGERSAQFLLLGSASRDLLQHTTESLAGRVRFLSLSPFSILEVLDESDPVTNIEKLWFRGGFPDSYLAQNENDSWHWRGAFISSYIERDIPQLGFNITATRMKRFWSMLAHFHGQQINFSSLGKSLEVSHTTVRNYLDVLTELYMVRQIQPWSGNVRKRIVKSPKIYIRDSGLLHRLLNISDIEFLFGHPGVGASWEGFIVENIINHLSDKWRYSYYRTTTQAEIDLILEGPKGEIWAVEIKRSTSPRLSKGFHVAAEDIEATAKFVVYSGSERYPASNNTEVIGIAEFLVLCEAE